METKMLDEKKHIDPDTGFLCRYVKSETEYLCHHYHNYYELFIVVRGTLLHIANNTEQQLSQGDMLFIRDFDIHNYKEITKDGFTFLNIAFTKETFDSLCTYLGSAFPKSILLSAKMPPHIRLTENDTQKLFNNATTINTINDSQIRKLNMRVLLADIFTKYFMNVAEKPSDIPLWLEMMYEKMKKTQNFIGGIEKMCEISGRTREHIARSMKKYYKITPLEYINELKLNYAANLLMSSNLSIAEICYECGFQNLSWFYSLFNEKYSMTPNKYKKNMNNR